MSASQFDSIFKKDGFTNYVIKNPIQFSKGTSSTKILTMQILNDNDDVLGTINMYLQAYDNSSNNPYGISFTIEYSGAWSIFGESGVNGRSLSKPTSKFIQGTTGLDGGTHAYYNNYTLPVVIDKYDATNNKVFKFNAELHEISRSTYELVFLAVAVNFHHKTIV